MLYFVNLTLIALTMVGAYALGYVGAYLLIFVTFAVTILALIDKRVSKAPPSVDEWLFLAALALLAIPFAINGGLVYTVNFLLFALYIPIKRVLNADNGTEPALMVSRFALAGLVVAVFISAVQVFNHGLTRAEGFASDAIWSAQAIISVGFFVLLGSWMTRRWQRYQMGLGAVLAILVAILSGSRGAILAIPVLGLLFLIAARLPRWTFILSLIGLVAVCFGIWTLIPNGMGRMATIGTAVADLVSTGQVKETSVSDRVIMYQAGIAAFLDAPIFGHGWAARVSAIAPYVPSAYGYITEVHHHLHSDSLDFAVSAGIFGLIAYALVLIAPIAGALKSPRDALYRYRVTGALGLTLGYAIFGLSYLTFGYEFQTTLYVYFTAILLGFCAPSYKAESKAHAVATPVGVV